MQAMSFGQALCLRSRFWRVQVVLCFILFSSLSLTSAFEFDLPLTSINTDTPTTIGYRLKFDGSDETRWMMNITDVDGRNPETLNDGEVFEADGFTGKIEVVIDREGPFLLKAVNPDRPSQGYATSFPGVAIDADDSDGSGDDGGGSEDPDPDGGDTGDSGGDTDGNAGSGDDGDSSGGDAGGGGEEGDTDPSSTESTSPEETEPTLASIRPTPTRSPIGAASKRPNNAGLIAGCVVAAILLLLLMLALLFFFRRRRAQGGKAGRPLTFYRDRMIRAGTPPQGGAAPAMGQVHGQGQGQGHAHAHGLAPEPISILHNPHDYAQTYPGYGSSSPSFPSSAHQVQYPAHAQHQPTSASATGVALGGPPVMREFILRSPRPLPNSPGKRVSVLKDFILSPRPGVGGAGGARDSVMGMSYSKA